MSVREDCYTIIAVIFLAILFVVLLVDGGNRAYRNGYRLVRVTPTMAVVTPVVKDITIWLDDVEWFCLLQDKEWECEETGRTRKPD